jgi:ATP-dependent DNA helicase RecG
MPMQYKDEDLRKLLDDIESDLVERKESWAGDAPEKGRQAVCAFANDLPDHRKPGVLFVGVKDDGTPVGLDIADQLLQTLSDIKTDGNILPPPTIIVEKRQIKGTDVAVVTVQPADAPPVRYKGRIWIRIGPRRGIATPQDERILNEKRRHRDLSFDVQPLPSCPLAALGRMVFEQEYLPQAFARDILEANERSFEQQLAACKMIASVDKPIPTVLGLLVLGKSLLDWIPGAYVQFLRIDGETLADPILDELKIDGPLTQIIRSLDEKLQAHNRVSVDISSGHRETRGQQYPPVALQQLTRNAIMHRTYEGTNSPSRVYWFNNRIEILSPGGTFGIVTRDNFGQPGITDYRNPNLAEAMKVLGFVQRFGVGIAMANKALLENDNSPAEFQINPEAVLAILRRRP